MKKAFLIAFAVLSLKTLQGQNNSRTSRNATTEPAVSGTVMALTSDVPDEVSKRFKTDYPAYKPVWSKEGYNYRADYMDGANMGGMVVYDKNGRMLRSETELQANSYPGSIGDYHTSNVPRRKYKVYETKDTTNYKGYYTITDEDEMLMFDEKGTYKSRTPRKQSPSKEVK